MASVLIFDTGSIVNLSFPLFGGRMFLNSLLRYSVSCVRRFSGPLTRGLIDVVFPPTCLRCGLTLSQDERHLCEGCWRSILIVSMENSLYADTRGKLMDRGVNTLISSFVFEKDGAFQVLAHALKYDGFTTVGVELGRRVGNKMAEWGVTGDVLIPIPLHRIKQRERGFNQAERIAFGISQVTGIPVGSNLIRRIRHTKTQTKLGIEERKLNVEGAFEVDEQRMPALEGMRCVIVDDVITTGATIASCGDALLKAGAKAVIAASAALAE